MCATCAEHLRCELTASHSYHPVKMRFALGLKASVLKLQLRGDGPMKGSCGRSGRQFRQARGGSNMAMHGALSSCLLQEHKTDSTCL
jgi:hypothetical protein